MLKKRKTIIKATFIAGSLEILAALISYYLQTNKNPLNVLIYISSGLFGKMATDNKEIMFPIGLYLHFLIVFVFTLIFSKIYQHLRIWFGNDFTIAIVYGICIWLMMNLIILPNSAIAQIPFSWATALLNCAILIVCVGMPLSFLFSKTNGRI